MKATELRIGQIYFSVKWKKPVSLTAEDIYELVHRADGADISYYIDEIFAPIPLTEEWFKRFGFEFREGYIDSWEKNGWGFTFKNGESEYTCGEYTHGNPIQHVHQLQNLYFALTGEELKLQ